ncbi:tetratricopeptide repeat-containing sensor histidine kinase [Chitinophaga barathri]|uniref:Histidine kinase n=1 Tax=Chitinophaga barathri TaxID=1647451 RepID=A0A3N4M533_9BACT|nr:histidine kinase [Chitinophaga barathri]RPD38272.1 histidine kinase [Chitinophaga barathri]
MRPISSLLKCFAVSSVLGAFLRSVSVWAAVVITMNGCTRQQAARIPGNADSVLAFMKSDINPHFHDHHPEAAGRMLDSLHPIVLKLDDVGLTCSYLRFRGVQYIMEEKYDSARAFINESMQLAKEKDSTGKHIIAAKIQLADLLKEQHRFDSALHYARDAYYLAHKSDTNGLPIICLRLSEIYMEIGDEPAIRKYLFEGFERATQPKLKTVFANNIAKYYDDQNQPDSAVHFFKAMLNDTLFSNPYFDAVKYENLGILLGKQDKPAEGLPYQLQALALNKELGTLDGESVFGVADTYYLIGRYAESEAYLDTAYTMAKESGDQETITSVWRKRAQNHAARGQYQQAYASMDSSLGAYRLEVDSSIAMQARELETQYAVKAKDEEIQQLAFENKVNRQIRQQQRLIIASMILGAVLVAAIGFLLYRRRKLEQQLRETSLRQRLLRSQMEPHFIFNTLSVLQSFIRNDDREKSIRYLNKFAKLVRISLENARESFVPLKDEITALESYLSLQLMRFEGTFDYSLDVYDQYEDDGLLIPPMLLQPFVENAIQHGMRQLDRKGMISIRIERGPHVLHCVIEDNGRGMQEEKQDKTSLSTVITQDRLSMLSKQTKRPASLRVIDKRTENGEGIRVELDVPFRR